MTSTRDAGERRVQLADQRRKVDFDTYDVTVDELLRRVARRRIDIAPVYQRQFRWDPARQSRLIESILLGIPVPPLFMATNQGENVQSTWEVVDGLQRLLTLANFAGDDATRVEARLGDQRLRLQDLDKLTSFDRAIFVDLPNDIRTAFEDRPLKVIVLNDKSDLQVRYDLFERLNTGGISLTQQEIRECVFRGEFIDLLGTLTNTNHFKDVVILPPSRWKDGTPEDFVLRFFAFKERYKHFDHSVTDFLNEFTEIAFKNPVVNERSAYFHRSFGFLAKCFPGGIRTQKGLTPVNLFEAVAVGASLALDEKPDIQASQNITWITSGKLRDLTSGGTNNKLKVVGRIEFCRDQFLGR